MHDIIALKEAMIQTIGLNDKAAGFTDEVRIGLNVTLDRERGCKSVEFKLAGNGAHYTIDHITTNLMQDRLNNLVPLHEHPVFHIIYILEGKGRITVGPVTTKAEPGMLYIISPNEPHRFLFGDGSPLTNLESTFRMLDASGGPAVMNFFDMMEESGYAKVPEAIRTHPLHVPPRSKPVLTEGFHRILDLYGSLMLRNHFGLMVADLMMRVESIVGNAVREDNMRDPAKEAIESIKHYLYTNRGRSVTLQEAADFAHVTPNYLCRLFKEHTGETPMGYLQTVRMREAESLLSLTDLPVYTIAERLGYEEPSYFARVFRGIHGESPQRYRKHLITDNRIK